MTNEYQGGVEVLVVLLDVVGIVLYCLPLVHGVEVDTGIVCLDGLEEDSESILEAGSGQRSATQTTYVLARRTYHFGSICSGDALSLFSAPSMILCACSSVASW